jgi:ATP-dependent RNA helicase DDX6/DHH1
MSDHRAESQDNQAEDFLVKLNLHAPDTRLGTTDVYVASGHEWEDYFLRRELLMGLLEKGWENPSLI